MNLPVWELFSYAPNRMPDFEGIPFQLTTFQGEVV